MMTFLITQSTYHEIQISLICNMIQTKSVIPKTEASKNLMLTIKDLLDKHDLSCADLDFIGANQGPAPFTTLRVLISTINGIAFASNVPLVGVDGLKAFLNSTADKKYPQTVILLNAYNNDLYYAYKLEGKIVTGFQKAEKLFEEIKKLIPKNTIRFLGNGASLFQETIKKTFAERAFLPKPMIEFPSLEAIKEEAVKLFEKKETVKQLQPLYLKTVK